MSRPLWLLLVPASIAAARAGAADPPKKQPPAIAVAMPLGIKPGMRSKLKIRGLRMDDASEVRFLAPGGLKAGLRAAILKREKVPVPPQEKPERVGDTQIEIEVDVPAWLESASISFTVVGPEGESAPRELLLDREDPLPEREPNDGFRAAQPLGGSAVIAAAIDRPEDVDVFAIEARAGERLVVETFAARLGSPVDPTLTLYDAQGNPAAFCDDVPPGRDARLDVVIERTGRYLLAVQDAHDRGGPAHLYRLQVQVESAPGRVFR